MQKNYSDYTSLLQSLQNSDLDAIDYLYKNSRNRLFVIANSIIEDEETSKDLVQEFFMEFLEKKQYLSVTTALKTYLYNSIRNKALNFIRNEAVRLKNSKMIYTDPQTIHYHEDLQNIEYHLDKDILSNHIQKAISNLPPMAEKVFTMHYLQFLTHAEIAQCLNISKNTVSNHMDRALKELRLELKKNL